MSLNEVEHDPFDGDEFVERLAWRTSPGSKEFDPMLLHFAFKQTIEDLKRKKLEVKRKIESLEQSCIDEEKMHWQRILDLQKKNQKCVHHFGELDGRINSVATKVVGLGDQLEGVNGPRTRDSDAQNLIRYFEEFMIGNPTSEIFTNHNMLQPAADIIQKLYLISQELPSNSDFDTSRDRIKKKYEEIEKKLSMEFEKAFHEEDKRNMRRMANILAQFKSNNQCIELFIRECQKKAFVHNDVFGDVVPLLVSTKVIIDDVFINSETVMYKMIVDIFQKKLTDHVKRQLSDNNDSERYLQNMYLLYTKTNDLSSKIQQHQFILDNSCLPKLIKNIFNPYLENYINNECNFVRERCKSILNRYYDSLNHQKKIISGGVYDISRDLKLALTNMNLSSVVENYGGQTFLDQELAINLLQEAKLAFKRCQVLSNKSDLSGNASLIFEIVLNALCVEHIEYALEIGLQCIAPPEPKTEPEIYFFDVVGQANSLFHLFEKQFNDSLSPLIVGTAKHTECLNTKRKILELLESKMNTGLDRTVLAISGWARFILKIEQKKSDFEPEESCIEIREFSPACQKVVKYIYSQYESLKLGLDGKNIEGCLTELGIRLHRVIFDHFQQFSYNYMGAMLAICDVNEYRKLVKEFNIPLVDKLFNTLHSLCNLLSVVPDNLTNACKGEQLMGLDKSVLLSFVQLRADYKRDKLATYFK